MERMNMVLRSGRVVIADTRSAALNTHGDKPLT